MRLFFAAMLPEATQRELGKLRRELEWLPTQGSWSPVENLHITMKFLGEVADDRVMEIVSAVKTSLAPSSPLKLRCDGIVMFPPAAAARVLGVGLAGDVGRLCQIQEILENECAAIGFVRESREYVPHITLARFRDGLHQRHRDRIEQSCMGIASIPPFEITSIQLMQSTLSSAGPTYMCAARFAV